MSRPSQEKDSTVYTYMMSDSIDSDDKFDNVCDDHDDDYNGVNDDNSDDDYPTTRIQRKKMLHVHSLYSVQFPGLRLC